MPLCAVVLDRSEVAAKEQRRTTVGERSRGAPSFFSLSAWVRDGRGGRVVRRAIDTVLACQGLDPPPPSVTWRRPQPAASSSSSIRGRGVADLPLLGRHWPDKLFFKLVPTFGAGEEEWWIASLLWEAVDFPTPSCCLFRLSPDVLPSQQEPWELGVEKHGAHEVHIIYWHCISLLYFRSLPQGCYRNYEPHLIGLIMNENTGDFLSLERAEILCSMSFVLLKGFLSEQSRDGCCNFCSVQMADVVSWLLKAFVLSGESPSLLEEVCDFVDVLGEALLLPSLFPAWMLLSMFDSTNKPTTMLLPVYSISKEAHNEDSSIKELDNPTRASDKKWKCPWSCTIVDYVAPTFRKLLEDNFRSLSGAIGIPKDGQENTVRWWSDRMKLNDDLNVKV